VVSGAALSRAAGFLFQGASARIFTKRPLAALFAASMAISGQGFTGRGESGML
jgi:hypothetical protein